MEISIEDIKNNFDNINNILESGKYTEENIKALIENYQTLYNVTSEIKYKKPIGDLYYYYLNDKEKALNSYLEYADVIKNDNSIYYIISAIYKELNDLENSKKYLKLGLSYSCKKINSPIPSLDDVVLGTNIGVAIGLSMAENYEESLETYKTVVQYSENSPNILEEFTQNELEKANELYSDKQWQEAMIKYKNVFNSSKLKEKDFINLISCLSELKQTSLALEYMHRYEMYAENKDRANFVIANLLYFNFDIIPEAIERFERYVAYAPNDDLTYNTLGHLYSVFYKDKFLDKQLKYFLKACELYPNSRTYTKNAIFIYNRLNDVENVKKCFEHLFKINPTADDYFDYGCFLLQHGNFKEGFKYLEYRFEKTEDDKVIIAPMLPEDKRLKNIEDAKDHTILVQCEQGFGDSIMFLRFVRDFSKFAKKVILVVQDSLVDLFKNSNLNNEIYGLSTDYSKLDYDYHISLMSLPRVLETEANNIPYTDKYLSVTDDKIKEFKEKYINKNDKIKIGIAYEGHTKSKETNRDIKLKKLLPILKLDNVETYLLQLEDNDNQIADLPSDVKINNIGKNFKSFEDTACAIMNMDCVVTTDNVILNLAGALGKKTFALFNKYPEFRWFSLKEDVAWYKSVKPYKTTQMDIWNEVVNQIAEDIKKLF